MVQGEMASGCDELGRVHLLSIIGHAVPETGTRMMEKRSARSASILHLASQFDDPRLEVAERQSVKRRLDIFGYWVRDGRS